MSKDPNKAYKNLLQEYHQKNKLNLPLYSSKRIDDGIDNAPIWKSTVIVANISFNGISGSKKDADNIAANHAYKYIISIDQSFQKNVNMNINKNINKNININVSQKSHNIYQKVQALNEINVHNYKIVLLVDGENCDFDITKLPNDTLVLIFASKNTSKKNIFQFQNDYENCYIFISQCVGRDAADHLLTYYAGKLSILYENMQYYILTKDHYGEFLEKFMNKCKFICSISEIGKIS